MTGGLTSQAGATDHTVSGTVALQEIVNSQQAIAFDFVPIPSGSALIRIAILGTDGSYSFNDIPAGRYTVGAKGSKWLHGVRSTEVDVTNTNAAGVNFSLLGGDANDDNSLDVYDLDILIQAFNTTIGDASWDARADFNCDDFVDVFDLDILIVNFNFQGYAYSPAAVRIASLSVEPGSVSSGGTATGTITLTYPCSGVISVTVKSNRAGVLINNQAQTVNVNVGAGSSTATFTVNATNSPTEPDYVTLSASANNWVQATTLTWLPLPANYPLTVQNLTATPGNGCVLLDWMDLPEASIKGFNIYRNGASTPLNNEPVSSSTYADIGLTNTTNYTYVVKAVMLNNTEVAAPSVNATPTAAAPIVQWSNSSATLSGWVQLDTSVPLTATVSSKLLINGKFAGVGGVSPPGTASQATEVLTLDTSSLANGSHALQICGYWGNYAYATPVYTVQVQNDFSAYDTDDLLEFAEGDAIRLYTKLPADTVYWKVEVRDAVGALVRFWNSTGGNVQLVWDGKNELGQTLGDSYFSLTVFAVNQAGTQKQSLKRASTASNSPEGLALIGYVTPSSAQGGTARDDQLGDNVQGLFNTLHERTPSFTGKVLRENATFSITPVMRNRIKQWMRTSVRTFYFLSHGEIDPAGGAMTKTAWRGITFWPTLPPVGSISRRNILNHPDQHIVIDQVVIYHYDFVWLDCCHSAGGGPITPADPNANAISTPDGAWTYAFGIISFGAFWGWDGNMICNALPDGDDSAWYRWRVKFLYALGQQYNVIDAATYATQHTTPPYNQINPWDQMTSPPYAYRAQLWGDPFFRFP